MKTVRLQSVAENMQEMHERGYVIVTDTIPADGQCDVSDAIQKLIDDNPNRTIYFPDGLYRLDKPICTPAHPQKSVANSCG